MVIDGWEMNSLMSITHNNFFVSFGQGRINCCKRPNSPSGRRFQNVEWSPDFAR